MFVFVPEEEFPKKCLKAISCSRDTIGITRMRSFAGDLFSYVRDTVKGLKISCFCYCDSWFQTQRGVPKIGCAFMAFRNWKMRERWTRTVKRESAPCVYVYVWVWVGRWGGGGACVRASVRASVRACVRACVCVCVWVSARACVACVCVYLFLSCSSARLHFS